MEGTATAEGIGLVVDVVLVDGLSHVSIAVVVVHRCERPIDGDLVEIDTAQAGELRIGVREQPPLQQRIVAQVYPGHQVAGIESHLLGLSEEIVRIAVQGHFAHALHRHEFLRDQLGGIEKVEGVFMFILGRYDLHTQFPFRVVAVLDGLPQITPVEIRILTTDLGGFVPGHGMHAEQGFPMEFHEAAFSLGIDQAEGVHAETLHHA